MNITDKPSGRKIYLIFLLIALIITAASALAQSSKTNTSLAFPELRYGASQPTSYYEIIEIPENFDYTNLKIEIYQSDKKIKHCYVCYAISENSFVIDLNNFAGGTYRVNVVNGKNTFNKTLTVSK